MQRVDDTSSETDALKIGIGGIKFSEELVHIAHLRGGCGDRSFADLIHLIAQQQINIPFICVGTGAIGSESNSCFCIAAGDFFRLEQLLDTFPPVAQPPNSHLAPSLSIRDLLQITRGVGTLTIFPHRRSLAFLGGIVAILAQAQITIHSLCTSISALAINVDFQQLDAAVEVLKKIVDLPEDHAPFRPEFSIRQISP